MGLSALPPPCTTRVLQCLGHPGVCCRNGGDVAVCNCPKECTRQVPPHHQLSHAFVHTTSLQSPVLTPQGTGLALGPSVWDDPLAKRCADQPSVSPPGRNPSQHPSFHRSLQPTSQRRCHDFQQRTARFLEARRLLLLPRFQVINIKMGQKEGKCPEYRNNLLGLLEPL